MTWTDPFESLVESTVEELGHYLRAQNKFSEHDIARIQEVCRDFCHFHCKDIRKATKQDYAFYLQLHALSAEDESEYAAMLSNIQKFAMSSEPAPASPIQPAAGGAQHREKKITKETLQSETAISELFMLSENQEHGAQLQPPSDSYQFPKTSATNPASASLQNASPRSGVLNRINEQDLSAEDADMLNNETNLPESIIRKSQTFAPPPQATHAASAPEPPAEMPPRQRPAAPASTNTAAPGRAPVQDTRPSAAESADAPSEKMRAVSGVAYNFDKDSLQKMRDFEKKQARATSSSESDPIDMTLVGAFRPYLFDNKYMVDKPLAKPDDMIPYPPQFIIHYLIPLSPAAFLIILAAILFQILVPLGLVFLILGCIALAFVLPDVLPAVQQTPQAALHAYLNARAGRCYGRGSTILAHSKSASKELDMPALWMPEPKWIKALLQRFKSVPQIPTRTISGSEAQNAVLLLHSDESSYRLISMVRIGAKWYICDPDIAPRDL
ncbi:MAG: hypothetical protein IKY83_09150 [Proteobacteria bacterium]|nr:hypothetical protein [Pseudomonadota bacterium]